MKYVESENLSLQEQLSALHDGELSPSQADALVRATLSDEDATLQWRSMSVISSVLREQQGVSARRALVESQPLQQAPQEAANDGVFRWKMVAGVAAFAAVGSLTWALLGSVGEKVGVPGGVMAKTEAMPVASASGQGLIAVGGQLGGQEVTMIRDPRLDELLAAHKQFGGITALQRPAGSLRSASLSPQRP